jgi:hypothetical protein
MNNTTFVSDYKSCTNEKVFVDKMQLYYTDINEKDPETCKLKLLKELQKLNITVTSSTEKPKELNYYNTKNGSSIVNCMVMIVSFSIGMLITTVLLPYLVDSQLILSIIITLINIAIIITIFMLTYYLFDNNNVKDMNDKIKISNYKFNGMTIMGYITVIMGLIIFFVCGVPNMYLLFYPEQITQPIQSVQTINPVTQTI